MIDSRGYGVPASLKSKGAYAAAKMDDVQGGLHSVKDEAAMIQIPSYLRQIGMEVYVDYTRKKYRLVNNPSTNYTVLRDWKYIPDAISSETLNKLVTNDELNEILNRLEIQNKNTFVTSATLSSIYMTSADAARYYQTKEAMKFYVSADQLANFKIELSKIVSEILPLNLITVAKGTDYRALAPPTTAQVIYGDGTIEQRNIIWNYSTYDSETPGMQIIDGTVLLPDFIDITINRNIDKIRQFIKVVDTSTSDEIVEVVHLSDIADYDDLNPIVVSYGTELRAIDLPSQVRVTLVDDEGELSKKDMPVIWDYSQFTELTLTSGVELKGDITISKEDNITNILNIRPKISIIMPYNGTITPTYQYKRGCILNAGTSVMESDLVNRLDYVSTAMFYGVANDPSQRLVDIRFTGLFDDNGVNLTPEITERYPEGIRMPVATSTEEDVEAFLSALREFDEILGYPLEYEVPGGPACPKVLIDDETHRLNFGSVAHHNCGFLIRRSASINLPYPDIC